MLRCLGGNSPYLAMLAAREPDVVRRLISEGPDVAFAHALSELSQISISARRPEICAALRQAKRSGALISAIADIGGIWSLEQITGALSELAESALRVAVGHLLRRAHELGEISLRDAGRPDLDCGFVVLAMGKLGASELNYSSDIDLILMYDATAAVYAGTATIISSFTSRFARDLVTLMQARDANGYVFRTDLRLRPDPAATPLAVSFHAALIYYETMGQNWERAAMIKARPIAGDLPLGGRFLEAIRPFVWRRGLDFAAVADIHAMRRRIDVPKKTAVGGTENARSRIAGHNVKLGEGGIREIEFLVQTLQMVWGGRDPALRLQATLLALRCLAAKGHLTAAAQCELEQSYRFLRRIEHRIQMINDRQIHSLPDKADDFMRLIRFLDYSDPEAFAMDFLRHVKIVRTNYLAVFEQVPDLQGVEVTCPELDFRGDDPHPATTVVALNALGYQDTQRIVLTVRQWLSGRVRALRSSRARDLMTTMVPAMLVTLARQPSPDDAFRRFDRLIGALPAGVQPMSLFQRNPILLDRVATVLGAAPMLSEHLARHPSALEGLLSTDYRTDMRRTLRSQTKDVETVEEVIRVVRRTVKERDFMLSVATLEGSLSADASGRQRTALAEAALSVILARSVADATSRFGAIPGSALAVVALGKAGGREMMAGSDLDLMFIYDHPAEVTESRGGRGLPVSQWFVRAVQGCVAALTSPGPEGQMYALDMRLRPSGNKGPIAVSLESFRRYHEWDSWTWERMALTRARVVAGPVALRMRVDQAIDVAIQRPQEAKQIRTNVRTMRERIARSLRPHGPWDVKLLPGGLVDIEFIAQTLQLVHARKGEFHRRQTTQIALRRLIDGGAITRPDGSTLMSAERLWRTVQGMLRMTVGAVETATLPYATTLPLLRAAAKLGVAAVDAEDLLQKVAKIAERVQIIFERYVGRQIDEC